MAGTFGGSIKLAGESEYRQALKNITQSLREVSSELKLTSSQYDSNDKSVTNLKNKQQSLNEVLKAQANVVESAKSAYDKFKAKVEEQAKAHSELEQKYKDAQEELEKIKETSGETSKEYQEQKTKVEQLASAVGKSATANNENENALSKLRVKLDDAQSAYNATEREVNELNNEMKKAQAEENRSQSSMGKLNATIEEQENKLAQLKEKYANLSLEQGKSGNEAKKTANEIKSLSREINENKQKLEGAKGKADEFDNTLKNLDKTSSGLKGGFTVMKGALADLASNAIQSAIGAVQDLAGEAVSSADSLKKFESTMGFAGFDDTQIKKAKASMKDYADKTVYDLDTISNTTAQLASNGIKDYTGLTEAAGNLNAVAGGNADTFKSVAMVMTQTAGAGKLTTENWNQLADAIPGASGKLQEQLKKNKAYTGDFRDAMSKGQITADEFNKAIMGLGNQPVAVEASKSVDTFEGAVGNMQATVVDGLMKIIDAIGMENITNFLNSATDMIAKFIPYVEKAVNFVIDHKDVIIAAIAGITAGIMAWQAFSFISGIVSTVQLFVGAIQAGIPVMTALNAVLGANPIGIVVVAIVGLVTSFTILWNKSEAFRNFWIGLWNAIKSTVSTVVSSISSFLSSAWNAISSTISTVWNGIKAVITTVVNGISSVITSVFNGIKSFITGVWNGISSVTSTVWNAIVGFVTSYINNVKTVITTVFNAIKNVVTTVWNGIKTVTSTVWNAIKTAVSTPVNAIKSVVTSVWNGIKSTTTSVWNGIKNAISSPLESAKNLVRNVINSIKGFFNFKISWPHIPLPHFSIKPSGWHVGDLLKGKIPTLGITWHEQGGVFDKGATVLRGIGENGAEAVVPLERNTYWIKRVADEMRGYIIDAISMPKISVDVPSKSENINDTSYNKLVDAFKDALSQMKIEMDDEEIAKFVDRTVSKAIFQ